MPWLSSDSVKRPPSPINTCSSVNNRPSLADRLSFGTGSYLNNAAIRVWVAHPFSQRRRVDLHDATVLDDELEIPHDPVPDSGKVPKVDIGVIAPEPDEIKVAHDGGLQSSQHVQLCIKVRDEGILIRSAHRVPCLFVQRTVEVYGDGVQVVDGPDEEIKGVLPS